MKIVSLEKIEIERAIKVYIPLYTDLQDRLFTIDNKDKKIDITCGNIIYSPINYVRAYKDICSMFNNISLVENFKYYVGRAYGRVSIVADTIYASNIDLEKELLKEDIIEILNFPYETREGTFKYDVSSNTFLINNSYYIEDSQNITNSSYIRLSSNVNDSSMIENSRIILKSICIDSSSVVVKSRNVIHSNIITISDNIINSTKVAYCKNIDNSIYINDSSNILNSALIYNSYLIENCLGICNLSGCKNSIFCSKVNKDDSLYYFFNKKVSQEFFEDIQNSIIERLTIFINKKYNINSFHSLDINSLSNSKSFKDAYKIVLNFFESMRGPFFDRKLFELITEVTNE